jgi:hypothetical protein
VGGSRLVGGGRGPLAGQPHLLDARGQLPSAAPKVGHLKVVRPRGEPRSGQGQGLLRPGRDLWEGTCGVRSGSACR